MEEKEVAQGLFDGGVRKTFCGKKEMYVALHGRTNFFAVLQVHARIQERRGIGYENAYQGLLHRR